MCRRALETLEDVSVRPGCFPFLAAKWKGGLAVTLARQDKKEESLAIANELLAEKDMDNEARYYAVWALAIAGEEEAAKLELSRLKEESLPYVLAGKISRNHDFALLLDNAVEKAGVHLGPDETIPGGSE